MLLPWQGDVRTGQYGRQVMKRRAISSMAGLYLAVIPGLNKLYVSSRKQPKLWVVDASTLRLLSEIDLGDGITHQMVSIVGE